MSGVAAERCGPPLPSARSFPAFTCGIATAIGKAPAAAAVYEAKGLEPG